MAGEEIYGEEGYTAIGHEHYTSAGRKNLLMISLMFGAGALTGAGLALLFAPASGKETRQYLKKAASDTKEKVNSLYTSAKEKVGETYEKGKEYIQEKKPLLQSAVEAGVEAYEKEKSKFRG
jgi:gas vesicle protein